MKERLSKKENEEWEKVTSFGNGIIYAKGNERKLVTPDAPDFEYIVNPDGTVETTVFNKSK